MKSKTFLSMLLIVTLGQFFSSCNKGEFGRHKGKFGGHKAANLRCEYMINPMGLDTPSPRLTWQLVDDHTAGEYRSLTR